MFDVLFGQQLTGVAIQIDTGLASLEAMQVTPAGGVLTQSRAQHGLGDSLVISKTRGQILEDANLEWLGLSFSDEAGREFLDQVGNDLFTVLQLFSVFHV